MSDSDTESISVDTKKKEVKETIAVKPRMKYSVMFEKYSDTPLKAQVEKRVLILPNGLEMNEKNVTDLLKRIYAKESKKPSKYHGTLTNIFVYAYENKSDYESKYGGTMWKGAIMKGFNDKEADYAYVDKVIEVTNEPEKKVKEKVIVGPKKEDYEITIENPEYTDQYVDFVIETNIPLPVDVMVGVDVEDLDDIDISIGESKRITLNESPQKFRLDISEQKLPSGKYSAEVKFYSRWGAENGNPKAKINAKNTTGENRFVLKTPYGSVAERKLKDKRQAWVINNVTMGMRWDLALFKNKLGAYEINEVDSDLWNSKIIKAYYFKEIDYTIIKNDLKNTVVTWRMGH